MTSPKKINYKRLKTLALVLFLAMISLVPKYCLAGDYHVVPSPMGSDANPGTVDAPWATIQHAADKVVAGDNIFVGAGNYLPFHVSKSGTSSNRITFKASESNARINGTESYDGRFVSVTILGNYITLDGFEIDVGAVDSSVLSRGIRVSGTSSEFRRGVVIRNNIVRNAGWVGITTSFAEGVLIENNDVSNAKGQHGIYVANSADNPVIRSNRVYNNPYSGIQINADASTGGDGVITNAVIEKNVLFENGTVANGAIGLDGASYTTIQNNLIFSNHTSGITNYQEDASQASHHNRIINNTIVMPSGSRHGISLRNGSVNAFLRNNIIIHQGSGDSIAVDSASLSGLDSDYNIMTRVEDSFGNIITLGQWQSNFNKDMNSFVSYTSNLFANSTISDYTLRTGSSAIDAGTSINGLSEDIIGIFRPQSMKYDIGAYEYPQGVKIPNPPNNISVSGL